MRNRFAGICYRCGTRVEPREGHFERKMIVPTWTNGWMKWMWVVQHASCAIKARERKP